jgi:hypothetical protein
MNKEAILVGILNRYGRSLPAVILSEESGPAYSHEHTRFFVVPGDFSE